MRTSVDMKRLRAVLSFVAWVVFYFFAGVAFWLALLVLFSWLR